LKLECNPNRIDACNRENIPIVYGVAKWVGKKTSTQFLKIL